MKSSSARRPAGGPLPGRAAPLPARGFLARLLADGAAHHRAGRGREAAACFARACAAAPGSFDAHYCAGLLAVQQKRFADAATILGVAVRLDPRSAAAAQAYGVALARLGRFAEAETAMRRTLELQPGLAEAWDHLGYILKARDDVPGALACHRRAVELKPDFALGWYHLGLALVLARQPAEALECQDRALAIDPGLVQAHHGRALALQNAHRIAEAVAAYDRVLAVEPEHLEARSYRLMALNYLPEWSPAELAREHREYGRRVAGGPAAAPTIAPAAENQRPLRIAFLSPDLRTHSVAYFLEPLLAHLDPAEFSILLYHDHFIEDATTARLRAYASVWRNFVGLPGETVAATIRADAPDILVDLAGHTGLNRLPLFARRLAPVQITYLGYPNTTGLEGMDWRFVDAITDPPGEADGWHTETLVRFSTTAWSYAPPAEAPAPAPPPSAAGAPFTFGSFNNPGKISRPLAEAWRRLLSQVPGSRLRLKGTSLDRPAYAAPLSALFTAVGIDPARVEFLACTDSMAAHLALYHGVDVALDTFPYHGTTTTCEALWMGVPTVTREGDRHASRVGCSLLQATNHPEWIARDWDGYVGIAAELARDPGRLAAARAGLRDDLRQCRLLDHAGQAERFGAAMRECWRQHCARAAVAV